MSEKGETVVLICGDRHYNDCELICRVVKELGPDTIIIHGAAAGADTCAQIAAASLALICISVPANWAHHGVRAGPVRNAKMLSLKPDRVIAFHDDIDSSKGTRNMLNLAVKAGVPCTLYAHGVALHYPSLEREKDGAGRHRGVSQNASRPPTARRSKKTSV